MSAVDQHADVVIEDTTTALAIREPVALSIIPTVTASDLVARLDLIRETMDRAMVKDVDYGVIPGTDKPTLLKPGAEKLGVTFKLNVQLVNERERDGMHLTVTSHATVYDIETGAQVGYGEGMCSTYEKKYRYRNLKRQCPVCGKEAIIKGKEEYGGGWLCWKKSEPEAGCGAKFRDDDPEIVNQKVGKVENTDLPDLWNTVLKMAEKRARVDAILAVTGASALFTQDAEDSAPDSVPAAAPSDLPVALQPNPDEARDKLVTEILDLAAILGKHDASERAITKHRAEHTPDDHMSWLRSQLTSAQAAVNAKAREANEAS